MGEWFVVERELAANPAYLEVDEYREGRGSAPSFVQR